jgi:Zn finger protein HypA/HybF involved in hydrogenase expression
MTDIPKPLSKMSKEEREAHMRKLHELAKESTCRNCGQPYPKHQGVSGYCPTCIEKARGGCCA